jgi:glycerophosphoryl diester phosphodiesterase
MKSDRLKPEPVSDVASEAWRLMLHTPAAHRGLWSQKGAPENSLAAFAAAADAGYAIELDVRLAGDGEVMVFHDEGLERMVGRQGRLADHSAAELGAMRLNNTREPIPTLAEVLALVAGRSLIHVELKTRPGEEGPLDAAVAALIEGYHGPIAVIGFNPWSHAWWAKHRPAVLRGLDCRDQDRLAESVEIGRPHFLALSVDMLAGAPARAAREAGFPVVAWTVRSETQAAEIAGLCDNLIFESFRFESGQA